MYNQLGENVKLNQKNVYKGKICIININTFC